MIGPNIQPRFCFVLVIFRNFFSEVVWIDWSRERLSFFCSGSSMGCFFCRSWSLKGSIVEERKHTNTYFPGRFDAMFVTNPHATFRHTDYICTYDQTYPHGVSTIIILWKYAIPVVSWTIQKFGFIKLLRVLDVKIS